MIASVSSSLRTPIAALMLLLSAAAAPAQVLYSNYGPADSYSQGFMSATFAGYGKSAARFVPTASGEFDRVETSLTRAGGGGALALAVSLAIIPEVASTGGPPGGVPGLLPIWSASAINAPVLGRAIYTFTGPRAALVAGQAYWVVIEATDNTWWYRTEPPVSGATADKVSSPNWFSIPGPPLPAFRISSSGATPGQGACCNTNTGHCTVVEPAACTSLGLSFAGVGVTCAAAPCIACPADFNHSSNVSVQDIFDFLGAYFAGCP